MEKDAAINERTALMKERDVLALEKTGLEKTVLTLTKEKERLLAVKKKLEKSLLEITKIDVKMEKQRRKAR